MTYGTDPSASYYQQVQANLAPGQGYTPPTTSNALAGGVTPPPEAQTILGAVTAQNAPALAGQNLQMAAYQQQLGNIQPQLQEQQDFTSQEAGYQLGQLGISNQQTGLSQQGTAQSYGVTQAEQALQQQGIFGAQQSQALNFKNQMQSIIGGSAASGALNTEGSKQQQSTAQTENTLAAQGLQRQGQQLGLQEQLSAGDYARAQQNYGLIGQANGLSQQEVYTRLQNGLQQLGQGATQNQDALVAQMGGVLSSEAQGVGSTVSIAGLQGGINTLAGLGQ